MSEFTPLREAVDSLATRTPAPDFVELERRATRRGRRRVVAVAVVAAAVIVGSVLAVTGVDDERRTAPVEQPEPVVGAGPVWYDAAGLHHGDVVEQTPVTVDAALALVRTGALYLHFATEDVWFHPWGGDPRIVGRNSAAGPGGDPEGDTAAWFEGSGVRDGPLAELVVYDTAAGREISRTSGHSVGENCCEHRPPGNGFLQVSAEQVIWTTGRKIYRHDVLTGRTSEVKRDLEDVHDNVEVFSGPDGLGLRVPGLAIGIYHDLEGPRG